MSVFHQLKRAQIAAIVGIQLGELRKRLAEQEIEIELTDEAMEKLGEEGWDPAFGARPLKRVIQRRLENPLAAEILAGDIGPENLVEISVDGEQFVFSARTKDGATPSGASTLS